MQNKNPIKKMHHSQNLARNGILILVSLYFLNNLLREGTGIAISYSDFLQKVDRGQVRNLVLTDQMIRGESLVEGGPKTSPFLTYSANDQTLIPKLHEKGIQFRIQPSNPIQSFLLSWLIPGLILFFVWNFFFNRISKGIGALPFTKSRAKVYMETEVKTNFSDVAGIDEARDELLEIVSFLRDPERYSKLGGRSPKGVLLVGPPGTGKTLLARAVAGEAKVPFFSINGSEFVELFVGLGAARVRDLFEQARSQAPCILFIDEIDALGKSRALGLGGVSNNDEKEQTLNQLLAEMDGFDSSVGVIMLAATNRPEILDPALLRSGRFDRQISLSNPDQVGREKILKVHVRKIKLDPSVSLKNIASMSSGFSGADLANLVNEAALVATRRNADTVTEADFVAAFERILTGIEHKSRVLSTREKMRIAYHELGHATTAIDLNATDRLYKISIIPRAIGALGYTLQRPVEDRYVLDQEELMNKMAVLLGGRAAEKLFLKTASTGASDDLAKATDLASSMICQFGMSEKVGLLSIESHRSPFLKGPFEAMFRGVSERTANEVDQEIKSLLEVALARATRSLDQNRPFIVNAHKLLLEKETLEEDEIVKLWRQYSSQSSAGIS